MRTGLLISSLLGIYLQADTISAGFFFWIVYVNAWRTFRTPPKKIAYSLLTFREESVYYKRTVFLFWLTHRQFSSNHIQVDTICVDFSF